MKKLLLILVLLLLPMFAQGQATSHTAFRIRFGAALPPTCNPATGDVFFKTTATIGAYQCLVANTWTAIAAAVTFPLLGPNDQTCNPAKSFGTVADGTGISFTTGVAVYCYGTLRRWASTATVWEAGTGGIYCWAGTVDATLACDSGLSRINAGIIAVGTGAQGSTAGALQLAKLSFKADGAHLETNTANKDIAGTCTFAATTCTVTFTTAYTAAPACQATDQTAAAPVRSAPTTSNVVFTGGTGAGATDVVAYFCAGNPT